MAKLYCGKISHNPYLEEFVTEITERVFQIDGYRIGERLLEGIIFDIYFYSSGIVDIKIENDYQKRYFNSLNNEKWTNHLKDIVSDILEEGDEVEVPDFIRKKYFKNGINCSWIA